MRKRRWFTSTELAEMWDRWQRGESTKAIGRVLDRDGVAIHGRLAVYTAAFGLAPDPVPAACLVWQSVKRFPEALRRDGRSDRWRFCWVARPQR